MAKSKIKLDDLSRDELKALISDAEKALISLDTRRKVEAKRAAEQAAKEFGFSLDEVYGMPGKGPKATKGTPKFANPEDPTQTWTGRGRKPNWVIAALDNGKSMDDLAI